MNQTYIRDNINNQKIAGMITAFIAIVGFMMLFNAGSPTPIIDWPVETYMGLAFTIGWLSSVPNWLAYVLAATVLILIVVGFYKMGSWVYGLIAGKGWVFLFGLKFQPIQPLVMFEKKWLNKQVNNITD